MTFLYVDNNDPSKSREIAEASEMGWPPGHWPKSFDYEGKLMNQKMMSTDREGDIVSVVYHSEDNETVLEVLND